MSDPITDRLIAATADNSRAIVAIMAAAKKVWDIYSREIEPAEQQIVEALERHNPQLTDAGRALMVVKDLLDLIALEQQVIMGHLKEGEDDLKAALVKSTTLALGLKTLYNDPDTMTEALSTITEPTLDKVIVSLSLDNRLKLAKAIDRSIAGE